MIPKIVEQDRLAYDRMLTALFKDIDDQFASEAIPWLDVFKVPVAGSGTLPQNSTQYEVEPNGNVGEPKNVLNMMDVSFPIYEVFPTLKNSCRNAAGYITDTDISTEYLENPEFDFEDYSKLYGGYETQGSHYAYRQMNVIYKATMPDAPPATTEADNVVLEGVALTNPQTGESLLDNASSLADLHKVMPIISPTKIASTVMTYFVPAPKFYKNLLYAAGSAPLRDQYTFKLRKPIIEPVLEHPEGQPFPLPTGYTLKHTDSFLTIIDSALGQDIKDAMARVMPYTFSTIAVDMNEFVELQLAEEETDSSAAGSMIDQYLQGSATPGSTVETATSNIAGSTEPADNLEGPDVNLPNQLEEVVGQGPLSYDTRSLAEIYHQLNEDDEFNYEDAYSNFMNFVTPSGYEDSFYGNDDLIHAIYRMLLASRTAIRNYAKKYWAVATLPNTFAGSDFQKQLQNEAVLAAKNGTGDYLTRVLKTSYLAKDENQFKPNEGDPDWGGWGLPDIVARTQRGAYQPTDYDNSEFGFEGLPERNWDGTPLGLLLKDLPFPIGPSTSEYVFQDQHIIASSGQATADYFEKNHHFDILDMEYEEAGPTMMESGPLAGFQGTQYWFKEYINPAGVLLESFMGLSNDFWEDVVYTGKVDTSNPIAQSSSPNPGYNDVIKNMVQLELILTCLEFMLKKSIIHTTGMIDCKKLSKKLSLWKIMALLAMTIIFIF
jgi:hypothetical protein